jgi:hypothetical protein
MNVDWVQRLGLIMLTCAAVPACQEPSDANEAALSLPLQIEDTELGESAIDIGECRDTDCTAPTDDRPLTSSDKRTCRPEERGALSTAWLKDYTTPQDPECDPMKEPCGPEPRVLDCGALGQCIITGFQIAPGADDDLWVLANIDAPEYSAALGGLWLAHYSAAGAKLSSEIVASDNAGDDKYVTYSGAISVDERNHVFLVVGKQSGAVSDDDVWLPRVDTETSTWLVEFDAEGVQVGPRVSVVGAADKPYFVTPRPAVAGPGSLALLESQLVSGSIAMISMQSRAPRWVQTREGRLGLGASVVDADGQVSVVTTSPDRSPSGRLEHYAANGELTWERTLPWREHRDGGIGGPEISLDGEGNLLSTSSEWNESQQTVVQKIAPDGETVWITGVVATPLENLGSWGGSFSPSKVLVGADGTLVISGGSFQLYDENGVSGPSTSLLYELSSDGTRCGVLRWESEQPDLLADFQQVALADDGSFYFASWSGFGRVER